MEVIGTINTSVPDCPVAPSVSAKYTVVRGADWDATVIAASITVPPVPRINFAESEAKNRDPLLTILTWPTPDDAFAESGEEGEGRDVDNLSNTLLSDAADA